MFNPIPYIAYIAPSIVLTLQRSWKAKTWYGSSPTPEDFKQIPLTPGPPMRTDDVSISLTLSANIREIL